MSGHGPDAETFERASKADLKPHYIDGTLAFMFETRLPVRPTRFALEEKILQHEYYECWQSLKKNFPAPRWPEMNKTPAAVAPNTEAQVAQRPDRRSWTNLSRNWEAKWVEQLTANDPKLRLSPAKPSLLRRSAGEDGRPPHLGVGIGDIHPRPARHCKPQRPLEGLARFRRPATAPPQRPHGLRCRCPRALRARLMDLLDHESPTRPQHASAVAPPLTPMESATLLKPVEPANYTDFYASIHHATRVGRSSAPTQSAAAQLQIRPHRLPRPRLVHRRQRHAHPPPARPIKPPRNRKHAPPSAPPRFLDYELEVAAYIGTGNPLGEPIPIPKPSQHIFGLSLVNDWSARDIQSWEYQPLGPFLGKSFATSVSPWVVPDGRARSPFACRRAPRRPPAPYLFDADGSSTGASTSPSKPASHTRHARRRPAPHRLSQANLATSTGPRPADRPPHQQRLQPAARRPARHRHRLRPEDPAPPAACSNSPGGKQPIQLPNGETRTAARRRRRSHPARLLPPRRLPDVSLGECRGIIPAVPEVCPPGCNLSSRPSILKPLPFQ
jgi:fumarylacetoacetase